MKQRLWLRQPASVQNAGNSTYSRTSPIMSIRVVNYARVLVGSGRHSRFQSTYGTNVRSGDWLAVRWRASTSSSWSQTDNVFEMKCFLRFCQLKLKSWCSWSIMFSGAARRKGTLWGGLGNCHVHNTYVRTRDSFIQDIWETGTTLGRSTSRINICGDLQDRLSN